MCGGNDSAVNDPRRFGALAILNRASIPSTALDASSQSLCGHIVLFNEHDHESTWATHLRFTSTEPRRPDGDWVLNIACTGDLSIPWSRCRPLYQLNLSDCLDFDTRTPTSVDFKLPQHLHLSVSDRGVIGRRVAISPVGAPEPCAAEGIIGFNTASTLSLLQA